MGLAAIERGTEDGTAQYSTMAGTVMGTAAYMSPEQAADTTDADHRSDIYSLGATLYFLLTGQPPYHEATAMKTMLAHREAPIPSPCAARADIPAALERIYVRMMAKDPARRFPSVAELVSALETLVANDPPPASNARGSAIARTEMPNANTTLTQLATKTAESQPRPLAETEKRFRYRRGVIVILTGLCILLIAGAAVVFQITTDRGELIVIADDPGVSLIIKRDEHVVRDLELQKGTTTTTIRAGHYVIELQGVAARSLHGGSRARNDLARRDESRRGDFEAVRTPCRGAGSAAGRFAVDQHVHGRGTGEKVLGLERRLYLFRAWSQGSERPSVLSSFASPFRRRCFV